jgi:biopolymer transport protein ExbD
MIEIERRGRHRSCNLSLTSLIDVMFVLMKFFVLTTSFVEIEALKLNVVEEDKTSTASAQIVTIDHELVLMGNGSAFLNSELLYYSDIEDKLDVLFVRNPEARIMVKCDEKVNVQFLVDVLDMIKRSGGNDVKVSKA